MPQACIFDFDGIIADTELLHFQSFQTVLEAHGAGFDWETYLKVYIAFDSSQVFATAFKNAGLTDMPPMAALIDQKVEAFEKLLENAEVPPLPGAADAVRLAAQNGPVALCTGAERRDVLPLLKGFGLLDLFQAIVTAEDVTISKPNPECYQRAASLLGIAPADCLAIEDTPGGLSAARGAGCQTLAVTTTHTREQLLDFADIVTDSLVNFPAILAT
ncbi:HAD family phosphatase [Kiritimatiellota bacterium B12222]|nr:HAD family phosphatase [Kiritimatiellota bacterium B12222]